MCLIFLSVNNHPNYSLIVASNRDEFYNRRTAPADFWEDAPNILGGRDLEANGTWMGVSRSGRISLLTNFRDPKNINPSAPSRGHLVSDFLREGAHAEDYLRTIEKRGREFNGFNLITGSAEGLWYYSNYGKGIFRIPDGMHGLSNHLLNTPWPKVEVGKRQFEELLRPAVIRPDTLFEFLYDDRTAPDNQLPDTGVGMERERVLSSMFIKSPNYGSRCSTALLIDRNRHVLFSERVFNLTTFDHTTRTFEFDIDPGT